jgi:mono/diheme cytochrome c family protein
MLYCMGCHGAHAEGVPGKVPSLARTLSPFMRTPDGRDYLLRVPGAANSVLSDSQLAAVLNWVAATFDSTLGSAGRPRWFTPEEVTRSRHFPLANVLATRTAVIKKLSTTGPAPSQEY